MSYHYKSGEACASLQRRGLCVKFLNFLHEFGLLPFVFFVELSKLGNVLVLRSKLSLVDDNCILYL